MIEDSSVITYVIRKKAKKLLICQQCMYFPELVDIYFKKDTIYIKYKCLCNNEFPVEMEYEEFITSHKIFVINTINNRKESETSSSYKFITIDNKEINVSLHMFKFPYKCSSCYYPMKKIKKLYFYWNCKDFYCNICVRYHNNHKCKCVTVENEKYYDFNKIFLSYHSIKNRNYDALIGTTTIIQGMRRNKLRHYIKKIQTSYESNDKELKKLFNLLILCKTNYEITKNSQFSVNFSNLIFFINPRPPFDNERLKGAPVTKII